MPQGISPCSWFGWTPIRSRGFLLRGCSLGSAMSDAIAIYRDALNKHQQLRKAAENVADLLIENGQKIAQNLRQILIVISHDEAVSFDVGLAGQAAAIQKKNWPTIESVKQTVEEFQNSHRTLQRLYDQIPQNLRGGVTLPEEADYAM